MKKLLIFFILIYTFGCLSIRDQGTEITNINCPRVFFSAENNVYIDGETNNFDLEKINFKASLNNYRYTKACTSDLNYNYYNLDLLIITEPINPKNKNINIPVFVLIYDLDNKLIDKQFFRINDNLNYSEEMTDYQINEVISNLKIISGKDKTVSSITVGFVNMAKD